MSSRPLRHLCVCIFFVHCKCFDKITRMFIALFSFIFCAHNFTNAEKRSSIITIWRIYLPQVNLHLCDIFQGNMHEMWMMKSIRNGTKNEQCLKALNIL